MPRIGLPWLWLVAQSSSTRLARFWGAPMPAPERRFLSFQAPRAAVAFLTRIPVDPRGDLDASAVGRGAIYFPLVGALVGGVSAALAWALAMVFPPTIAALG